MANDNNSAEIAKQLKKIADILFVQTMFELGIDQETLSNKLKHTEVHHDRRSKSKKK